MKKRIDYASICFSALLLVIVVAATITAVVMFIDSLGIQLSGMWIVLVGGLIWCVVVGFMMYVGMRKAKMKNGN